MDSCNFDCDENRLRASVFQGLFISEPIQPDYRDEFCCLFIWESSARSTGMKFKKQNRDGGHKVLLFSAVAAL